MELFLIYAWMKLDTLRVFLGVSVALLIAAALVFCMIANEHGTYDSKEDRKAKYNRWINRVKKLMIAAIFFGISSLLAPSSNQAAILVGSHYALEFAKSPTGAKIGKLLEAKVNQALDEQLKEIEKVVPAEVQKAASQVQNATK